MRIVILGSGRGSNAAAIIRSYQEDKLGDAVPVAIIADQPDAGILRVGEPAGVKGQYLDPGKFRTKLEGEGEDRYIEAITALHADLIVLAGFMRVLKPRFLTAFEGKIINLHPSLLPSFKGLEAIGQAFDAGVKITGCTVHRVTAEIDAGEILAQEAVRVLLDDRPDELAARVHAAEHRLLPDVIARLSRPPQ